MEAARRYRVIAPGEFQFTPPSAGDQARGVMRPSDSLSNAEYLADASAWPAS